MPNILSIDNQEIKPGERQLIEIAPPKIFGHVEVKIPVLIHRSHNSGPRLFITSGIHGDEIIGLEIIHKLLDSKILNKLKYGDVIIIPVVNMYGFILQQRYMPDRRDLNRSFPGNEKGSLGSILANHLCNEIIIKCTHGIDLHSGAEDHANLAQIRIDMKNEECIQMAKAFAPKLIVKSEKLDGSLRKFCKKKKIPILLFEGAEAHRFDNEAAETGYKGIVNVMQCLEMIDKDDNPCKSDKTFISHESHWERAPLGGIFRSAVDIGKQVKIGDKLGSISDLFGKNLTDVKANYEGLVIGINMIPTVNKGDALYHIALLE